MKSQEELMDAIEAMRNCLDCRLENQGGYPAEIDVLARWVIVADVDHDEAPTLSIYRIVDVLRAFRKAKREVEDGDTIGAMFENWPDTIYDRKEISHARPRH